MKKNVKSLILSLLAMLTVSSLVACDGFVGDSTGSGSTSDVTSESVDAGDSSAGDAYEDVTISLSEAESVMRFEMKQLTATVKGTQEKVTWASSNPAVATVDENGLVSALTLGETVITATIGTVSASCTVTVFETDIPHEVEVSLDEVSVFEGKTSEEVTVSVSYDGEILEGDFQYIWSLVDGDEDVVSVTTSADGSSATFQGLKVGTVTYEIYTEARGYEAYKEITITVKENTYSLGIKHENIFTVDNGYAVDLTLGDEATDNVTFDDVYLAINGEETDESITVSWTLDNDKATFADGTLTAVKAGTAVLTGTATYKDKTVSGTLTATIKKGVATVDDTDVIETAATKTFTVPTSIEKGEVEKIYFGQNVIFDKAAGKGSISGNVVTLDVAGMPAKEEDLGKGKELSIETNLIVYTMSVDVYTMIIDNAEELDQWQTVAVENAVKAGLCVEQQKGITYSGYFLLGGNIEYNKAWKPYKAYGELWALCYSNKAIWKNETDYAEQKTATPGQLIDGAFQEDWGKGNLGGFQGVFDGQGYYINGLSTAGSGDYNAFIVTLGGGTVRNIAFTNMTIGQGCGSIVDRGQGLIENVYIDVNKIESGKRDDLRSWGLIRGGNAPKHGVNNAIVDYSDADLSNVEYVYLGCDITSEVLNGVYLVGVPADFKGGIWNNAGVERHQIGSYATYADLLADEKAASVVKAWDNMWEVADGYVIPTSVKATLGGGFSIIAAEKSIYAGGSLALSTNKAHQFMSYSLKNAVDGVSVEGNVVKVSESAQVGAKFTVVVTSMLDNTAAEITLSVAAPAQELADTMTIEVVNTETITLPESVKGTVYRVAIGSLVLFDSEMGIGELKGNVLTPETLPAKAEHLGKGIQMTIASTEATYLMNIDVYTMIINDKAEFDQWQAVAADNSVKAGVVIEEQKYAYLTGYFILGDNIEYNNIFKPIIPYAGENPSLYNLCNKTNNNVLGWISQYGADKVIAVNGWTDSAKLGFHGTLDGNGYYINGLRTDGLYSGIAVISGTNAVWKNLVFTNASVGAKSGFLFNRGGGTIENVYVELASIQSGAGNDLTVVAGLNGYSATNIKNFVVDASRIDFSTLTGIYLVDLYAAPANGAYVIGANGLEETMNQDDAAKKGKAAFWFLADNDVAGSFATAADLLADETHGALVKSWAGDFWAIDEANGKIIPKVLTEKTPAYFEPKDYYVYTPSGKPLDFYLGDVTALGFEEGTIAFGFGITNGWTDRIEIRVPDTTADYFTFDFVISSDSASIAAFCIWPRKGTQGYGNYDIVNTKGLSWKDGADERKIVVLDKNGNDVTKGPWQANTVYTVKIYRVGTSITIDNINFSTFTAGAKLYVANVQAGNDAE